MKQSSRILITGGLGYIGSHLSIQLLKMGHELIIIDNLSNSSLNTLTLIEKATHRKVSFYEGDINDIGLLNTVFERHLIEIVVHLSASKYICEAKINPAKFYSNNTLATKTLLNVMHKHHVKRIVFTSTSNVYGCSNSPSSEDSPISPNNPYGASKYNCEALIRHCSEQQGFYVSILRLFNVVGVSTDLENSINFDKSIKCFFEVILDSIRNKKPIPIFTGNNTHDGSTVRDYIAIEDVVDALKFGLKATENQAYNLWNVGRGIGVSCFEIVRELAKRLNLELETKPETANFTDLPYSVADIRTISNETEWLPNTDILKHTTYLIKKFIENHVKPVYFILPTISDTPNGVFTSLFKRLQILSQSGFLDLSVLILSHDFLTIYYANLYIRKYNLFGKVKIVSAYSYFCGFDLLSSTQPLKPKWSNTSMYITHNDKVIGHLHQQISSGYIYPSTLTYFNQNNQARIIESFNRIDNKGIGLHSIMLMTDGKIEEIFSNINQFNQHFIKKFFQDKSNAILVNDFMETHAVIAPCVNIKNILCLHSVHLLQDNSINSYLAYAYENQDSFNKLVVLSNRQVQAIDEINLFEQNKMCVIPHRLLERPNITLSEKNLKLTIMVTSFIESKNVIEAIKLYALATHDLPNHRLVIYGDGPLKDQIHNYIKINNLSNNIELRGYEVDLDKIYRNATLLLSTSLIEGFPMSFLESISYGVPVITYDVYGAREIVKDGISGHVIKHFNQEEFLNKLSFIFRNSDHHTKLTQQAFIDEDVYDIQNFCNGWSEILK